MAINKPAGIRMDDTTRTLGDQQAARLGLNLSEYIRLIIHLDAATEIIERLSGEKSR